MTTITERLAAFNKTFLLKQSLFGLPWIIIGGVFPYFFSASFSLIPWIYVPVAFFAARLSGMSFNRLIDHYIDAKNPRTANRPLPRGEMSRAQVFLAACIFLVLFFWACSQINALTFQLSPWIAALLIVYSFTKRFTWLCHLVLGLIQFFGPVCAWIATSGAFSSLSLFLGFSVGASIAANDILYACQDMDFDRKEKLYSIPACFGATFALYSARTLHFLSFVSLIALGLFNGLSFIYFVGAFIVGGLFILTYLRLLKDPIEKVFAWSNISVGLTMMAFTLGELSWSV